MKTTEQKVINFIKAKSLIDLGDKLLVCLSGGPDSVFALKFFLKYKKKYKLDIFAIHINHNLRGKESDKDEEFCKTICAEEGIGLFIENVDVKKFAAKNKLSVEEAARKIRYDVFSNTAKHLGCSKIVTAHNKSDNAETVLLNLIKGTGIQGLGGIPVRRDNIVRPLLCLTKEEITEYLDKNKIDYRIDRSNESDDYHRNFLRNQILTRIKKELNPSVEDAVFRTSQNLVKTKEILLRQIKGIIKNELSTVGDEVIIPISIEEKYGSEILGEIIKEIIPAKFNIEIDFKDVEKIQGLFSKQAGKFVELKNSVLCYKERDAVKIKKRTEDLHFSKKLKTGSSVKLFDKKLTIEKAGKTGTAKSKKNCEYIDSKNLEEYFEVRNWRSGDKFIPLGLKHFKKVSDFLTDIKVPPSEKQKQLVLLNRDKIVWVVGYRIDERFKLTEQTKETVRLCLK